jgi:UDP-N-acetylmuramoylalanine--D-glutamate ligase
MGIRVSALPASRPPPRLESDCHGQTVVILGLAREGASLARHFLARGARVMVTDSAPADRLRGRMESLPDTVEHHLGGDHPDLVTAADRFFVSPGVPPNNPVYRAALAAGLAAESMTTLFFSLCPAPIVGITGSSGKTTTTSLIGHILRTAGRDVAVGGNIGDPMLDLLPQINPNTAVVLELSSFQLEIMRQSPHIALITNISPNHLDRHETMERYIAAKRPIVAFQGDQDYVVLNAGDPSAAGFRAATPAEPHWFGWELPVPRGATVSGQYIELAGGCCRQRVLPIDRIPLLGRHNVENVLAACAVAAILEVAPESMAEAVRTFRPPAHRLEVVGERAGVRYVDDSIATSPDRAVVALQALTAPIVLIAGGRDKQLPWDEFARTVVERARALILLGEAADQIQAAVTAQLECRSGRLSVERIVRADSIAEAVNRGSALARQGDIVLLSPACTSYDMFTDYEERGQAFARAVEALDAA